MKDLALLFICMATVLVVGVLSGSMAHVAMTNPRAAGFLLGVLSALLVTLVVVAAFVVFDRMRT